MDIGRLLFMDGGQEDLSLPHHADVNLFPCPFQFKIYGCLILKEVLHGINPSMKVHFK